MEEKPPRVRAVLGTMTFGRQVSEADAARMVVEYAEAASRAGQGRPELDTAYLYQGGETERVLGRVLGAGGGAEAAAGVCDVASKVNAFSVSGKTLSRESVLRQARESLARLGVSKVRLLYLHGPDPATPVEETMGAVAELHAEGAFDEFGLSNFAAWQVAQVCELARARGWPAPAVYQGMYNAVTRAVEPELMPCLRHYGIRVHAYNPLAGGLLTGKYRGASVSEPPSEGRFALRPHYQARFWKDALMRAVDVALRACDDAGLALADASFRWLAWHSGLRAGDAVIFGASSMAHARANMASLFEGGPLPDAVVAALDEAWRVARPEAPTYFR